MSGTPGEPTVTQETGGASDVGSTGPATAGLGVPRRHEFKIEAIRTSDQWLSRADPYDAAIAFIRGDIDVHGDLAEAVRSFLAHAHAGWRRSLIAWLVSRTRLLPWYAAQLHPRRARTARNLQFHYDHPTDFYRQFLDSSLVYSCAYFEHPGDSLDRAQDAKLQHICRKLRLAPGERFLDVGCGWGALLMTAARCFGVTATGCTLSSSQARYAAQQVRREGLEDRVAVLEKDYRDVGGEFDKIASIGMFEHVGRRALPEYFRDVSARLHPHGLFLNHGIVRRAPAPWKGEGAFISTRVFPEGELVRLEEAIVAAERAGFEVLDVESLRRHYALTCRAWVDRLRARREACLALVDDEVWRTWQLYLAGSAVAFEEGQLDVCQILLAKQGCPPSMPMTRAYMYPRG